MEGNDGNGHPTMGITGMVPDVARFLPWTWPGKGWAGTFAMKGARGTGWHW